VRLNALAPGAIMTPLLAEQLSNPIEANAVRAFPIPDGGFGRRGIWPTGCASCYRMLLTSYAAALFSSTAGRTRIFGPTTGRNQYRRIDCLPFCAGSEAVPAHLTARQTCDEPAGLTPDVSDTTTRLFVTFTKARHSGKRAAVKFDESAHRPNKRRIEIVAAMQPWINQSPTNLDVANPIKARACDALEAVLGSKSRRAGTDVRVMRRGAERC
jgi:hypothetical protein